MHVKKNLEWLTLLNLIANHSRGLAAVIRLTYEQAVCETRSA